MHAIRGSWVGQTFALARCHDSGERKARIRRSKEERKELVVSFIKKYQFSNKGDFPSLSVTQREVGGSFYIIREIVREIIQENRVLGPAKSTIDEQNANNFFDQHPLGSIAMEPDTDAVSSSEPHVVTTSSLANPLQNTTKSQALDFSQECHEPENQKLNDGIIVNGSSYQSERTQGFGGELENEPPIVRGLVGEDSLANPLQNTMESQALDSSQECHEPENQKLNDEIIVNGNSYQSERTQGFGGELENEPPIVRGLVGEDILEKELAISETKHTQVAADVVIETFPIKPVTDKFALDGDSGEPQVVAETLKENESGNMDSETVMNVVILNKEDVEEKSSRFVDAKTNLNVEDEEADPSPESLNHSAKEISALRLDDDRTDLENNEILPAEMNHTSVPNGLENTEAALSSGLQGQSISEEAIATGKKSGIQNGSSSKKSSDPTLDRINLESWEETADRSGGPQTNSLLSFVKACITAFVKFWSE